MKTYLNPQLNRPVYYLKEDDTAPQICLVSMGKFVELTHPKVSEYSYQWEGGNLTMKRPTLGKTTIWDSKRELTPLSPKEREAIIFHHMANDILYKDETPLYSFDIKAIKAKIDEWCESLEEWTEPYAKLFTSNPDGTITAIINGTPTNF